MKQSKPNNNYGLQGLMSNMLGSANAPRRGTGESSSLTSATQASPTEDEKNIDFSQPGQAFDSPESKIAQSLQQLMRKR